MFFYKDAAERCIPPIYVEPYHQYYGEVNNESIPSNARQIMLALKGSYAIFAKGSTYNAISSTYDGRHNKMSTSEFHKYIKSMIEQEQWADTHPEEAKLNYEARKEREIAQFEIEKVKYELHDMALKVLWNERLTNVQMPIALESSLSSEVYFTIEMKDQYFENEYYVSSNNKLILDSMSNIERLVHGDINPDEMLKVYDLNLCLSYINQLKDSLLPFEASEDIEMLLYFDVNVHRIKKPTYQFTKEELLELPISANDKIYNRVVIQTNGKLELISNNLDYLEMKQYVYKGMEFNAFQNACAESSKSPILMLYTRS